MTVTRSDDLWVVQLPCTAPYDHVRLRRRHSDEDGFGVVIVDPARLLFFHDRDQMRIAPPNEWPEATRLGLLHFLDPNEPGAAEMPVVNARDAPRPGWWARLHKKKWPAVAFTNGRHRAHILAHLGAAAMPVEVSNYSIERVRSLCEVTSLKAPMP